MRISTRMKVYRVMQGEWGSCLFSCNSYHPFSAHFPFPALPLRSCRQQKQGEEFIVSHLLLVPSRVIRHWTIVYMHVLHWCTTHSNCGQKILPFISKYIWMAGFDRHSFLSVFLPHFTSLFMGILKKIGHTGIANTKKWLDQAVFPCWSNYHTLAGE